MWKTYELPHFCIIAGKKFSINTDWRVIIDIFECLESEELIWYEKIDCVLSTFYNDYKNLPNIEQAIELLYLFLNGNQKLSIKHKSNTNNNIKLVDWTKDLHLIIPPVNNVLKYDIREKEYVHWWTFLGAFREIGECTFRTYVGIRYKLAKHKTLEKWEKEIYCANKDEISISKSVEYDNFDNEDILVQLAKKQQNEYLIKE